ncbi:hypothetical protein BC834DRAFT_836446, partial [Gloeopeniophorella convolvens]
LCARYSPTLPTGCSPHSSYPFGLHDKWSLPWDYETHHGALVLRAHACTRIVASGRCTACKALATSTLLKGILWRIEHGVKESSAYLYHGIGGLIKLLKHKMDLIDNFRLCRLNDARKLVGLEGVLDTQKKVLLAVSSQSIPRIDRVLRVGFNRGASMQSILLMVQKAADGVYRPKGFDERDNLLASLFLRYGGARLANMTARVFGTPAASTIRKRTNIPILAPSPSMPTLSEVTQNIRAALEAIVDILAGPSEGPCHAVLMWDELAIEQRPRWDDKTNNLLGFCRECTKDTSLEFSSMKDLDVVFDELERGEVHLASEATVGAIGLLSADSRLYSARPILASGSCKRESARDHVTLLQTTINAVNSQKALTRARIVSLASDGEARRGKALVHLTFKSLLSPTSSIYLSLSTLSLMDLHVGDDDITADKDYKHVVFKRLRNVLLREKGSLVLGVWITPALLRRHLLDSGHTLAHVQSVLNPADKQDVELAYRLERDIWSLKSLAEDASKDAAYAQTRDTLCAFGSLCYHLIFPYICVDLSLSEQLGHLSSAAHLAMALYTFEDAKSRFLPNALYIDIMIMIKNVFFCVAKAKVDMPERPFYLILLGTDRLESLFGILRTMVGNDANLDMLQLALRVTGTTEVANILAKHPEWDRAPRRLHLPTLTRDAQAVHGADHISPRAWRGSVVPQDVTLATCWKRGRRFIEDKFPFTTEQLRTIDETPGASILAPFGTLMVKPLLTGESSDTSVLALMDDNIEEPEVPVTLADSTVESDLMGEGLRTLEDAASQAEWGETSATSKGASFSNQIDVNGKGEIISKARALAQRFKYKTTSSSTDRLRRVQQEPRYMNGGSASIGPLAHLQEGPRISVTDPVASLVRCDGHVFLCLGEINNIKFNSQAVEEVLVSVLHEKAVQISYQVISLIPATDADDPSKKCDWRSSRLLPITLTVPGALIHPINPLMGMREAPGGASTFFILDSPTLVALASTLHDRVMYTHARVVPSIKPSNDFPYREPAGTLFISWTPGIM